METKENPPPYQPAAGPNQPQGTSPPPTQQGYPQPQQGHPGPNQGYPPPHQGYPPPHQGYPPPHQGYPPPHQGYPPPHQGYPPPMPMQQQQQQQQNTTVVIQQPTATNTVLQVAPPDHFIRAVLACFFCFWPTGLIAIYFAHRSRDLFAQGDVSASYRMANNARNLIIVSVLLGLGWIILVIVTQSINTASSSTTYHY